MTGTQRARSAPHAPGPNNLQINPSKVRAHSSGSDDTHGQLLDIVFGPEHGYVAVAIGTDGYWTERGKYEHRDWTETRFRWPDERDKLLRQVNMETVAGESVDVYWCPALRATPTRRKGGAIDRLHTLWADLDEPPTDEALLDKLDPIRLSSGSDDHLHIYVLLAEPVTLHVHELLNQGLARALGGDAKWADNSLLRLPGTLNHKHQPPGRVEQLNGSARVWDVNELAGLLEVDLTAPATPPRTAHSAPEAGPTDLPDLVRARLRAHVTDRSEALHALVGACRSSALTLGQTHTIAAAYAPAVEKYGDRIAAEVERSWAKVDPPLGIAGLIAAPAAAEPEQQEPRAGLAQFLLPADVWTRTPALTHIYRAAMARLVTPDALLHGVLAILASLLHHGSRVETGKGASPLCYFVAPIGESGAGKSEGVKTARELLTTWIDQRFAIAGADGWIDAPLGSGEGLIEAFMGEHVTTKRGPDGEPLLDKAGNERTERVRAQVRHNGLFTADEGRQVLAIDARKGSTVLAVLCELWSGATAGQTNAEAARTRKLRGGTYVVALIAGFQVATVDALFADEAGGTPQRFVFAPAEYAPFADLDDDEDDAEWPGELNPNIPVTPVTVQLAPEQRREVRRAIRAKAAGRSTDGALDGHRMLLRCRLAALLALLHGHTDVDTDTWDLAGLLVAHSCGLRDWLAAQGRRKAEKKQRAQQDHAVETAARAAVATQQSGRVIRAASHIVRAVEKAGGTLTRGRALHALRSDLRDVRELALDRAATLGLVELSDDGRTLTIRSES